MPELIGCLIGLLIVSIIGVPFVYLSNRSRCTLDEVLQETQYPASEVHGLIQRHFVSYRRKYVITGPRTLNLDEVRTAYAQYQELLQLQEENAATLRHMAESAAAEQAEKNRNAQEQARLAQEELERLRHAHAEILKRLRQQLHLIPEHVQAAFAVLGLSVDAPFDQVRQRYRELAKQSHPDTGGDAQHFIQVDNAYKHIVSWINASQE
ncbi:J domain-containing protein [Dictyobacter kobayashii]|uniref:J domain-containing protein n=1 Tax=Dictyobacter kobayashii TaxID=2014872 RepID=A0A402ASF0_9CHLR|nr:J domain-containing protein [Dictyobacter kobayashii]GCE22026.1 hypothetical protein KDK_58260 [Dictyobacter kobayashii]